VKSILIADGEIDVRLLLGCILAGEGYAVVMAYDGQEALAMFAEEEE
jgi:CheY-like chemotaxis protein